MVRRFHGWLRVVLLSEWFLWGALACVLIVWVGQRLFAIWLSIFAPVLTEQEMAMVSWPAHVFTLWPLAVFYGLYRAETFHPVANRSYGTWLAQTPWKYPQPLPLGPLRLKWQDIVILAIFTSLALLPPYGERHLLFVPPVLFLFTYCGCLAYTHFKLGLYWACAAFLAVLAGGALFITSPIAWVSVAALIYGVTLSGIASSLRDFPYSEQQRTKLGLVAFRSQSALDVPLPILPADDDHWLSRLNTAQKLIAGLLVGAFFFGVAFHFRYEPATERGMLFVHRVIALIVIIGRLVIYLGNCRSPISFPGRIATRRLIISGFDMVYVAPLVAAIAAILLPHVLRWIGVPSVVAVPLATVSTIWLILLLPPGLEEWLYTGHHRMPAVRRIGKDFVET